MGVEAPQRPSRGPAPNNKQQEYKEILHKIYKSRIYRNKTPQRPFRGPAPNNKQQKYKGILYRIYGSRI